MMMSIHWEPGSKLLVCTFFLSSLIATHSCKCFLRVLLNPGKLLFKHIGVHLKVNHCMQQSHFKKQKKNNFFSWTQLIFHNCSLSHKYQFHFFQPLNKGSGNTKIKLFWERMKFLFSQGDRNLLKTSPQTRRLEMFWVLMQCLSVCHVKGMHLI